MEKWEAGIIDLTVTSPPYDGLRDYNDYVFDFESIAKQLYRVTKRGGVVVWVVGDKINGGRSLTSFRQAIFFQNIGFSVHDIMIYQKKNTGSPKTFNPLKEDTVRSGFEKLTHNKLPDGINKKKIGELKKEKTKTNIWSYAVGLGGTTSDRIAFEHPAIFPEKLAHDHIVSWNNEGDLVLDPMCGSGTTCKVSALNNRRFIGCDSCNTGLGRFRNGKSYLRNAISYLEEFEK